MRVCIGVHSTEVVLTEIYLNHMAMAARWAKACEIVIIGTEKVKNAKARNVIAEEAIKQECTHWLALDTDHLVRENLLPLLLEHKDAAMVSGLICKRAFPFSIVGFKSPKGQKRLVPIYLEPNTGVREVDGCAMGCTLINLKLLQELEKPWFFDLKTKRSDLNLCKAFREKGHPIYIDTRAIVGHVVNAPVIWPDQATSMRKLVLESGFIGEGNNEL